MAENDQTQTRDPPTRDSDFSRPVSTYVEYHGKYEVFVGNIEPSAIEDDEDEEKFIETLNEALSRKVFTFTKKMNQLIK